MPLYEFECRSCHRRFETLVRGAAQPVCPSCGTTDLERTLSTFAVGAASTSAAPIEPCGRCGDPRGAGSCSLS